MYFRSNMKELITTYFKKGYSYKEIVCFLEHCHGIKISLRTLKTRLKKYGLSRRGRHTDDHIEQVVQSIRQIIETHGGSQGYRNIWHALNLAGISATRDLVMNILRELDPEGAALRKRKRLIRRKYHSNGPSDLWHADGYDKLKPYGFPIHGCIDGYSRKIIWLRYVMSNNNPYTVGKLYFDVVKKMKRVPSRIRTDWWL